MPAEAADRREQPCQPAGPAPPGTLTAHAEPLADSPATDPPAFRAQVEIPDVESQWSKKAVEVGCLLGFALFSGTGVIVTAGALIGLIGGGKSWWEFFTGGLLLTFSGLIMGPLVGLGAGCVAILLECILKTAWGVSRRKVSDDMLDEGGRSFAAVGATESVEDLSSKVTHGDAAGARGTALGEGGGRPGDCIQEIANRASARAHPRDGG
jgi:hypothetical protein